MEGRVGEGRENNIKASVWVKVWGSRAK